MTRPIETSRNGCALHGALQTIQEIEGFVPIIHSNAGCGLQQFLGGSRVAGCNGSGNSGGFAVASTNVIERQVIFGGTSRLREQIKNTVKVIKGDLYVVLPGCTTELVGDDIPAMTKEGREQGFPIVNLSTPGFKGQIHYGYITLVKGLVDELAKDNQVLTEKSKGLVNILGIIPKQDVFWKGNLEELKRILEAAGLKVNTLVGYGEGIESWKEITNAELNIVFSPWGVNIGKHLEEHYGTPYLEFEALPVGAEDTRLFLTKVAEKLNLDSVIVNNFIEEEKKKLDYYIEKILDFYVEYNFQKEFAIVGEASNVLGISRFLTNSFGLIPKVLIITDKVEDSYKDYLTKQIANFIDGFNVEVYFTEDGGEIKDIVRKSKIELVLGSSLEKEIAEELKVPLQVISFPIIENVVLNKGYAGFRGAISLIEDLSSAIITFENHTKLQLKDKILA